MLSSEMPRGRLILESIQSLIARCFAILRWARAEVDGGSGRRRRVRLIAAGTFSKELRSSQGISETLENQSRAVLEAQNADRR